VNELQKNLELNPSPLLRSVAAVPCKNWKNMWHVFIGRWCICCQKESEDIGRYNSRMQFSQLRIMPVDGTDCLMNFFDSQCHLYLYIAVIFLPFAWHLLLPRLSTSPFGWYFEWRFQMVGSVSSLAALCTSHCRGTDFGERFNTRI